VILFDLGLGDGELEELLHFCNGSMSDSRLRDRCYKTPFRLKNFRINYPLQILYKYPINRTDTKNYFNKVF
jgi:hypothetical protein